MQRLGEGAWFGQIYKSFSCSRRKKAPSAALKGQDDNSPGQARNERRPGKIPPEPQPSLFPVLPRGAAKQEKGRCSLSV